MLATLWLSKAILLLTGSLCMQQWHCIWISISMVILCVLLGATSRLLSNHNTERSNKLFVTNWNALLLICAVWAVYSVFFFNNFVAMVVSIVVCVMVMVYMLAESLSLNERNGTVDRINSTKP